MTKEIEEQLSVEIDKVNNKLEFEMLKIRDIHCRKLDSSDKFGNVLDTSMSAAFDYKKCLDIFLIEIKALKEKYREYLDNDSVYKEKSQFVSELSELLSKFGIFEIKNLKYVGDVYEERIEVELISGAKFDVNVTWDSLDMMLKDLVKGLIYANEVDFEEIKNLPIALNNYEIGFDKGRFKAINIIDHQIKLLKGEK